MPDPRLTYLPVLIQIVIGLALPVGILVVSHIFGQRARANAQKDTAYECGNTPDSPETARPHPRYAVRFFVVALLFLLFDIEVVLLLPLALAFRELTVAGVPLLPPVLVFMGVLALGLLYEIKTGALEWHR
ncbi:MAG: NADH-quinone oxidoreductase subunit A [Puniceicoccales bacterium]|nr:NADH-quinone oxidoreductase subunit A [Puniceicoccales bacterium]